MDFKTVVATFACPLLEPLSYPAERELSSEYDFFVLL